MVVETKACTRCYKTKPRTEFHLGRNRKGDPILGSWCKPCVNARSRARWASERLEALQYYGGTPPRCWCCGEARLMFLALDHINGGGSKHKKSDSSAIQLSRWVKKNNFPPGFRVLCHNCNSAYGFYHTCPHWTVTQAIEVTL